MTRLCLWRKYWGIIKIKQKYKQELFPNKFQDVSEEESGRLRQLEHFQLIKLIL